jgi:hypothetical protein
VRLLVIAPGHFVGEEIKSAFLRDRLSATVDSIVPLQSERIPDLPDAEALRTYDAVFLDPELVPPTKNGPSDLWSSLRMGDQVLRCLRERAPELPVIAITGWLTLSPELATEVTMLPFDGYLARQIVSRPTFSNTQLMRVMKRAQEARANTKNHGAHEWDVFVCHASEDKETIVEPLVKALTDAGIRCWYDRQQIFWGESIITKVSAGLAAARYVLVVLSVAALQKAWPQKELSAALGREIESRDSRILPLFANAGETATIRAQLPLLADKKYIVWTGTAAPVMDAIRSRLTGD